jgi:DNA-binding XRE family transcriptional regulator
MAERGTRRMPDVVVVPHVPSAGLVEMAELYRSLVKRARAEPVSDAELLALEKRGLNEQAIGAADLAGASTTLAGLHLIENFRDGIATPYEIAVVYASIEYLGGLRLLNDGEDRWADQRREGLDIITRMAKDVSDVTTTTAPVTGTKSGTRRRKVETFGQRLRRLREARGLNQDELARKVGTSASVIRNWEKDRNSPQLHRLAQLARALRCSKDELLDR